MNNFNYFTTPRIQTLAVNKGHSRDLTKIVTPHAIFSKVPAVLTYIYPCVFIYSTFFHIHLFSYFES